MRMELFSSAAAGFFGVSASLLAQFGTSWPVVIVAMIGVGLALLEEENWPAIPPGVEDLAGEF